MIRTVCSRTGYAPVYHTFTYNVSLHFPIHFFPERRVTEGGGRTNKRKQQRRDFECSIKSHCTVGPSTHGLGIFLFIFLFSHSGRRQIMVTGEKRSTRSQTTIPDYLSRVQLDLSPLKQARSAMRNADVIAATDSSDADSSSGATSCKKRSASPPILDREENVEREFKRSRIFTHETEVREPSTSGCKPEPFPPSNNPFALPPPSVSGSTTPTKNLGSSPRARSVPPSIPTTPGQVPYLDLSKYRSPTKSAHRVRVMSVPPSSLPILGAEEGEDGVGMAKPVERDSDRTPIPRMVVEKVERTRMVVGHPPPALVVASDSDSLNDDPFSQGPDALLKTPVQKAPMSLRSASPPTPVGSPRPSSQQLSFVPHPPDEHVSTDPMNVDPPAPSQIGRAHV